MTHPSGMMAIYPEHSFSPIDNEPPLASSVRRCARPVYAALVGMRAMVAIMLPIALPMLLAAALQIPLKDIVLKLLKALV